jgi:hypothetical protein
MFDIERNEAEQCLTFDAKGEIIISSSGSRLYPTGSLMLFSPSCGFILPSS